MNNKGFTLIEMLVVVAIIGLLSSVVVVGLGSARQNARDARRISDIRQIQNALEVYYSTNQSYPDDTAFAGLSTPNDPLADRGYMYALVSDSGGQKYELGACLENNRPEGINHVKTDISLPLSDPCKTCASDQAFCVKS